MSRKIFFTTCNKLYIFNKLNLISYIFILYLIYDVDYFLLGISNKT